MRHVSSSALSSTSRDYIPRYSCVLPFSLWQIRLYSSSDNIRVHPYYVYRCYQFSFVCWFVLINNIYNNVCFSTMRVCSHTQQIRIHSLAKLLFFQHFFIRSYMKRYIMVFCGREPDYFSIYNIVFGHNKRRMGFFCPSWIHYNTHQIVKSVKHSVISFLYFRFGLNH